MPLCRLAPPKTWPNWFRLKTWPSWFRPKTWPSRFRPKPEQVGLLKSSDFECEKQGVQGQRREVRTFLARLVDRTISERTAEVESASTAFRASSKSWVPGFVSHGFCAGRTSRPDILYFWGLGGTGGPGTLTQHLGHLAPHCGFPRARRRPYP